MTTKSAASPAVVPLHRAAGFLLGGVSRSRVHILLILTISWPAR